MSERARALAERFERASAEYIGVVEGLSDEQWRAPTREEGRTVAALAHHIAIAIRIEMRAFRTLAIGQPVPAVTIDDLHRFNARHAAEQANCRKEEVLEIARRNAEEAAAAIRGFGDEQLDRAGPYIRGGATRTVEQWIERVLIGHVHEHLASIRAATGDARA